MNWYPVELHTHTIHSDGDFTVEQLVKAAKYRGFSAIACTDHNAFSGVRELEQYTAQENLVGIAGIEWTTYWGHMLVLMEQGYTDWRGVSKEGIDTAIANIHANHGIVGIAHPFALSNPVNTGYHWEFQVSDWDAVDFLEVWSRDDAPCKIQSYRAIQLWEQLLLRGCHITATSGRDWHREDKKPYAHTYVGIDGALTADAVRQAIQHGRVCLSAGALLTMQGNDFSIGDTISAGSIQLDLYIDSDTLPNDWNRAEVHPEEIRLIANGTVIYRCPLQKHIHICLSVPSGWFRADLFGRYYGRENQRLAFTNPIFVQK